MSIDCNEQFNRLTQVLQLMASEFNQQVSSLPNYVVVADEIALTFDWVLLYLDNLVGSRLVSEEQRTQLHNIDTMLNTMSQNKDLWSLDALRDSQEWHEIRRQARELLASLGIQAQKPDLYWVKFIRHKGQK